MIGRQKGNFDVLRHFVHLNETTINRVKTLGMTEKGRKSEFLIVIGEKAETTHSLYIVPTPIEYWLLTTYPRERWYRQWWLATHSEMSWLEAFEELARRFPNGLSEMPELPEERSGEVSRLGAARRESALKIGNPSANPQTRRSRRRVWRRNWYEVATTSGSHCVHSQLRSAFGAPCPDGRLCAVRRNLLRDPGHHHRSDRGSAHGHQQDSHRNPSDGAAGSLARGADRGVAELHCDHQGELPRMDEQCIRDPGQQRHSAGVEEP